MTDNISSYRPHDPGHDYYAPGIYLITLVVRNRKENARMFGVLNNDLQQPDVVPTEVGKAVMECWEEIPERQSVYGRRKRSSAILGCAASKGKPQAHVEKAEGGILCGAP